MDWYRCSVRSFFLFFFWCFNCWMGSCNVDGYEYHRPEELTITLGAFCTVSNTTVLCIVNDRDALFFSLKRFVWFCNFWICPIGSPKQHCCTLLSYYVSEFQWVSALPWGRFLSRPSLVVVILYQNDTSRPYFIWLYRVFVPDTTLQPLVTNLAHWKP